MCLKKEFYVACQQVSEITKGIDVEEKAEQLGVVITQLKHENEDIHDLVNPITPPEQDS